MGARSLAKNFLTSEIFFIDGFLSGEECGNILEELELAPWQPSLTYRKQEDGVYRNELSSLRVSETAYQDFFTGKLKATMRRIEKRLQKIVELDTSHLEYWQATTYPRKGEFYYHLDSGYWDDHYAGDRRLTFLLYLNTPLKGGGTHFRALDVYVEATAGRLLVWDNLFPSGDCNHRMIHSSVPLLKGKKTTLVTWQRQKKFRDQDGLSQRRSKP
jgi:prolyl 4-hydroxylase